MKKIILLFSIALSCLFTKAQTWNPVGGGVSGWVSAMCVYNGNLIVAGGFTMVGSVPASGIAMWNGSSWSPLGKGISTPYGVNALCVYNGILYVAGGFDSAGGKPAHNIAAWNGSGWSDVGGGLSGSGNEVFSMTTYNNNLIVGGYCDSAGKALCKYIAAWNGNSWSSLGQGLNWAVEVVYGYDSVLYASGGFDSAGAVPVGPLAQWNGSYWSQVDSGVNCPWLTNSISSIVAYGGKVYFGGGFSFKPVVGVATAGIAVWDGKNWSGLGRGISKHDVLALCQNNNVLYAGGDFDSAGSVCSSFVSVWDGSKWDSAGFGRNAYNLSDDTVVYALVEYNGSLYAGGFFYSVDNKTIVNIAQLVTPVGINTIGDKQSNVTVYPNPSSGIFNIVANSWQLMAYNSIEVYNMLGESIATTYSVPLGGQGWTLDLSAYPTGIYMYRILDKTGTLIGSGKLLKE